MTESPQSESELDRSKSEDVTFAPIATPYDGGALQQQRSNASKSMRSIERSWSLNDGTSVAGNGLEAGDEDTEFTVGWEENDPQNPRNMSKGRRWLIVIIVSMGSLCV
jgi:hypothetical protein